MGEGHQPSWFTGDLGWISGKQNFLGLKKKKKKGGVGGMGGILATPGQLGHSR